MIEDIIFCIIKCKVKMRIWEDCPAGNSVYRREREWPEFSQRERPPKSPFGKLRAGPVGDFGSLFNLQFIIYLKP
jgi:hypothetical protein